MTKAKAKKLKPYKPSASLLKHVHPKSVCAKQKFACAIHRPSDHHMVSWVLHLRETGLVERICPHGIGHPDPDSVAYFNRRGEGAYLGVHGCDGCCTPEPQPKPELKLSEPATTLAAKSALS